MQRVLILVVLTLIAISCDVFDKEETVPGFILISRADIETRPGEGPATHDINEVHVFADEEFVGSFELPATIAMLKNGPTRINISAGIRNNGLSNQRIIYPFMAPLLIDRDVIPGVVEPVSADSTAIFQYFENAINFEYEDFEGLGSNFVATDNSSSEILIQGDEVREGIFSGKITLTEEAPTFEAVSEWELGGIPRGTAAYLEIDFKGNNPLEIGLRRSAEPRTKFFVIGLNAQADWTKIYVEMTPVLAQFIANQSFEIYLESVRQPGIDVAEMYIDNIKFLYPSN